MIQIMENYISGNEDNIENVSVGDSEADSLEEGFLKGYNEDENSLECAECGSAVDEERGFVQEIDGDKQIFCSKMCLEEFKEGIGL